mmetsp:Transcript_40090/g.84177  ORF Transcript_40090/g.84177 Transcript_40090/m.84177 type:complete len:89 (-) Transcript_40090:120-386(-)
MHHSIEHVHSAANNEYDEHSERRPLIPEAKRRVLDKYTRAGQQYSEYRPKSILKLLCMMDFTRFIGEEVAKNIEEGGEAAAEYWGYAE